MASRASVSIDARASREIAEVEASSPFRKAPATASHAIRQSCICDQKIARWPRYTNCSIATVSRIVVACDSCVWPTVTRWGVVVVRSAKTCSKVASRSPMDANRC